jgi:hypothetical protein
MPLMSLNLMKFVIMSLYLIKKKNINCTLCSVLRDHHRVSLYIVIYTAQILLYKFILLKNYSKYYLFYLNSVRKCTPFPPNVSYKSRLLFTPLYKCPLVKITILWSNDCIVGPHINSLVLIGAPRLVKWYNLVLFFICCYLIVKYVASRK